MMDKGNGLSFFIPEGEAEAVSMRELARITGLDDRELRREIEKARRAGILICSSGKGYFMPETLQELREYVHLMGARIKTGRSCLRPFIRELRRREGAE